MRSLHIYNEVSQVHCNFRFLCCFIVISDLIQKMQRHDLIKVQYHTSWNNPLVHKGLNDDTKDYMMFFTFWICDLPIEQFWPVHPAAH